MAIPIQPPRAALDYVSQRVPVASPWSTDDWNQLEAQIRARAFFSSRIEEMRLIQRMKNMVTDFLSEEREVVGIDDQGEPITKLKIGSRADFVRQSREFMVSEGMMTPAEVDATKGKGDSDLTNTASRDRLNLIFDTQTRQGWGYAHWKQGMTPNVLKAYPAAKFIRLPGVKDPRPRHVASEDEIRLKNDFEWWADYQNAQEIGGFEVPWPPYGFRSYMDQEDVSRADAIRLGLLQDEAELLPVSLPPMNEGVQVGLKNVDDDLKEQLRRKLRAELAETPPPPDNLLEQARANARRARREAIQRSMDSARERDDMEALTRAREAMMEEPTLVMDFGNKLKLLSVPMKHREAIAILIEGFARGQVPRPAAEDALKSIGFTRAEILKMLGELKGPLQPLEGKAPLVNDD